MLPWLPTHRYLRYCCRTFLSSALSFKVPAQMLGALCFKECQVPAEEPLDCPHSKPTSGESPQCSDSKLHTATAHTSSH